MWTDYGNVCRGCGRRFRLSDTAMEIALADEPTWTKEEAASAMNYCLECEVGESEPGEYVVTPAPGDDHGHAS